jgi:hypothetical protein
VYWRFVWMNLLMHWLLLLLLVITDSCRFNLNIFIRADIHKCGKYQKIIKISFQEKL